MFALRLNRVSSDNEEQWAGTKPPGLSGKSSDTCSFSHKSGFSLPFPLTSLPGTNGPQLLTAVFVHPCSVGWRKGRVSNRRAGDRCGSVGSSKLETNPFWHLTSLWEKLCRGCYLHNGQEVSLPILILQMPVESWDGGARVRSWLNYLVVGSW